MSLETTASRLGATIHLSPLLVKARRLGLALPLGLDQLAVQRGCVYYRPIVPDLNPPQVPLEQFSNEELIVALLSGGLPHSTRCIRLAAALLGMPELNMGALAHLAVRERCETALRYIAQCAADVEPENNAWQTLLARLPETASPKPDALPHPSRFYAMSGITRGRIGIVRQWIRPKPFLAS